MPREKPLYQTIYEAIRDGIVSGHYTDKLPSDGQLVRRYATTRATVAKAMVALERDGLVARQPGAGTFVRPAASARGQFVSTLIAGLGDTEFFEPICAQIAQSCHACGLSLLWGPDSQSVELSETDSLDRVVARFVQQAIRGVFFVPDEGTNGEKLERNREIAERFTRAGIAVILLDRDIVPFPRQGPYDLVGIDNVDAGYRQARHLIERGCRRILYVTRPGQLWTKSARIQGYRAALEEAGLPCTPRSVCTGDAGDPAFCKSVLRLRPDGIVCFHDLCAVKLLQSLQRLRVPVPGRVKVIGLDDLRYTQYLSTPLTTLRQPCKSIGDEAASLMALRLNRDARPPRRILFDTQLVIRGTT